MPDNSDTLRDLIKEIKLFQTQCEKAEFTDTGEAHELLTHIKEQLKKCLPSSKKKHSTTENPLKTSR